MELCSVRNVPMFFLTTASHSYSTNSLIGPKPVFEFPLPLSGLQTQINFRPTDLSCHGFKQGVIDFCSVRNVPRFLLAMAISFILYQFPELIRQKVGFKFTGKLHSFYTQINFRPPDLSCHGFRQDVMDICSVRNVPRFLSTTGISFILYQFPELIGPKPGFKFTGPLPTL